MKSNGARRRYTAAMTSPADDHLDPARCPLCGQPNACANEIERATGVKQPPCWCSRTGFDAALLARVPAPALGVACICSACATSTQSR